MNVNPYHVERVNQNLLDNAYFARPVNQRGQTEYTDNAYAIDRWIYSPEAAGNKFVIENDCVRITGGSIDQRLPILSDVKGKTATLSVLMSDDVLHSITGTFPAVMSGVRSIAFDETLQIGYDTNNNFVFVIVKVAHGCVAAKLELGDHQTLAHQENGTWVLNEVPNYGQELAKCKRYFRYYPVLTGTEFYNNTIMIPIDFTDMAKTPVLSINSVSAPAGEIMQVTGPAVMNNTAMFTVVDPRFVSNFGTGYYCWGVTADANL